VIKVIATICLLSGGACHEETVTTTDMSGVTLQACLMGAPQLAEWMQTKPQYRLKNWKCQIGNKGNVA
jgi:hypothetical protein